MVVVFAGWLVVLSVVDCRRGRLPDVLTLPGFAVIVGLSAFYGVAGPALLGAVALVGLHLVGFVFGGIGAGDVKLALGLGAATGAVGVEAWVLAAAGAPLLTLVFAALTRSRVVPHGPSMCLATALAVLVISAR
jgi:leader peptidase (prepilin peptidase)/N-methyltransferase